ncbi:MAG: aspartate:alanine exchanger family transporter [Roseiflexaceae bacterium]|nr:aspartate:alanine exchanger family transporter [Roseiflexaceae bacterium]
MIDLLIKNPLLLLFVVAAIGYPLGHLKIAGQSLGVAAVLFVGLFIGAQHPDLKLPEVVYQLGVVLFVYTVGLSSGPGFFASFRRKGLRDNLFVAGMLLFAAGIAIAAFGLFRLPGEVVAGMYAGSLTNTPALASVLEYLKDAAPVAVREQILAQPVIGYSIAYPVGVIGVIVAISLTQRIWKIDYPAEAKRLRELGATRQQFVNQTIRVTQADATGLSIADLNQTYHWNVVFGRLKRGADMSLANNTTLLSAGDLISVVGAPEDVDQVAARLGEPSEERLDFDRSQLDYRRIFVSNANIVGRHVTDLHLQQQFGAVLTRIRRGDIELVPHDNTVLELGDRVRVVAPRNQMEALSRYFGDSYRSLSEIDVMTFSIGIALGLLLGQIPIPIPGGVTFRLGFAGGPLVVALILGAFERSGPLVWNMPFSANLTLRQVGLIMFLAGVGTRSGYAFATTFMQSGGALVFAAGALVTCITALTTLWIGHKLMKIPMSLLIGMLAGLQTQPAVLAYALEQTENDLPNIGYATVYPIAMVTKILLAQLLAALLLSR